MSLKHYKNRNKKRKALPSIHIGDRQTQEKALHADYQRRYAFLNAGKKAEDIIEVPYNLDKAVAHMHRRADKHFGLQNKYAR